MNACEHKWLFFADLSRGTTLRYCCATCGAWGVRQGHSLRDHEYARSRGEVLTPKPIKATKMNLEAVAKAVERYDNDQDEILAQWAEEKVRGKHGKSK